MSAPDDGNPYRFSFAEDEEPGLVEPDDDWNLGGYVRPAEEPILSPHEVRRLGLSRAEFLPVFVVTALAYGIILGMIVAYSGSIDWADRAHLAYFLLALLAVFPPACLFKSYGVARGLRYRRFAAAGLATLTLLPPVNLFVLAHLAGAATAQLRRHGISSTILGPDVAALPAKRTIGLGIRDASS